MAEFTTGAGEGAGARAAQLSSTLPRAHGADGNGTGGSNGDNNLEDFRSGGGKGQIVVREFIGPCEPFRRCRLVADCLTAGQAYFEVFFGVSVAVYLYNRRARMLHCIPALLWCIGRNAARFHSFRDCVLFTMRMYVSDEHLALHSSVVVMCREGCGMAPRILCAFLLVARLVFLSGRRVAVLFVVPDAPYSYTMVLSCDDLYHYLLYGAWNIAVWCCIDVGVYAL